MINVLSIMAMLVAGMLVCLLVYNLNKNRSYTWTSFMESDPDHEAIVFVKVQNDKGHERVFPLVVEHVITAGMCRPSLSFQHPDGPKLSVLWKPIAWSK